MKRWKRSLLEKANLPTDPSLWSPYICRRIGFTATNNVDRTAICVNIAVGIWPVITEPDVYAHVRRKLVLVLGSCEQPPGASRAFMPWLILDAEGCWMLRTYHDVGGIAYEKVGNVRFL